MKCEIFWYNCTEMQTCPFNTNQKSAVSTTVRLYHLKKTCWNEIGVRLAFLFQTLTAQIVYRSYRNILIIGQRLSLRLQRILHARHNDFSVLTCLVGAVFLWRNAATPLRTAHVSKPVLFPDLKLVPFSLFPKLQSTMLNDGDTKRYVFSLSVNVESYISRWCVMHIQPVCSITTWHSS